MPRTAQVYVDEPNANRLSRTPAIQRGGEGESARRDVFGSGLVLLDLLDDAGWVIWGEIARVRPVPLDELSTGVRSSIHVHD